MTTSTTTRTSRAVQNIKQKGPHTAEFFVVKILLSQRFLLAKTKAHRRSGLVENPLFKVAFPNCENERAWITLLRPQLLTKLSAWLRTYPASVYAPSKTNN